MPTEVKTCSRKRRRAAVGTAAEAAAFATLQSLVHAEMHRIHRLYYCTLLRCMVMPTRFTYLRDVQSLHVQPRQPIPEEFQVQAEGDCGDAYLMWLYCEIKQVREAFGI